MSPVSERLQWSLSGANARSARTLRSNPPRQIARGQSRLRAPVRSAGSPVSERRPWSVRWSLSGAHARSAKTLRQTTFRQIPRGQTPPSQTQLRAPARSAGGLVSGRPGPHGLAWPGPRGLAWPGPRRLGLLARRGDRPVPRDPAPRLDLPQKRRGGGVRAPLSHGFSTIVMPNHPAPFHGPQRAARPARLVRRAAVNWPLPTGWGLRG